jgi:hypothetical protein
MKIGEVHRTQSSSLYSANTIGAPMHPAPIGVADRTQTKNYWCTVSGQHCLLARGTSERQLGLGTEFRSEKIPRNRLGTVSAIPRKKVLIPRHSEFRGRANSEARNGTERNGNPRKNEVLRNLHTLYDHSDGLYILEKINLQNRQNNLTK